MDYAPNLAAEVTGTNDTPLAAVRPLNSLMPVSVFNFHHVSSVLPSWTTEGRKHITISASGLRQFIRTIKKLGFVPVCLKSLYKDPTAYNHQQGKRFCLLTFDDGLHNNYEHAWPVLQQEQCPATIFALPGKFGGVNDWDDLHLPPEQRDALMSRAQMQEMAASPYITFGSHGLYHSKLKDMKRPEIHKELHDSHALLQAALGDAYVPVFAYPWGEYSDLVMQEMANSPYDYAFTVENGSSDTHHNPMLLPRYTVFWRDGNVFQLRAKLYRHGLTTLWGKLK
jgi:peptidoglycan/xylan/chitin deacetylase (PgdA/CDA1 family)